MNRRTLEEFKEGSDEPDPRSSIIIVNLNGGSKLFRCVESLLKFTEMCEIIVVDNASSDGSLANLAKFGDVKIIRNHRNVGFSRANNKGIRQSRGRYVVLLNSDTTVTEGWLDSLIECGSQSEHVGLVTPKLVRPDGTLDSTGHIFHFQTCLVEDRGSGESDLGQYNNAPEIVSCSFACVLIRRELFDTIGFLDEKMFFYFEDVDFSVRAKLAGWRVVYCPSSVVVHYRGGSTLDSARGILVDKSRPYPLRIMLKTYKIRNAFLYGGRQVLLQFLGVFAGLKNGDFAYSISRFYSLVWNLTHPPLMERIRVQSLRRERDSVLGSP